MVVGDGVGHLFEQGGLTSLGLGHDEAALPLADGGEEVDNAGGEGLLGVAGEFEFLVGEEGGHALEGDAVAYLVGGKAVDFENLDHGEELVAFAWRTHAATDGVAGFETVLAYLLGRDVDIVGRREVVVVARTEESVAVWHHLEHAFGIDNPFVVEGIFLMLLVLLGGIVLTLLMVSLGLFGLCLRLLLLWFGLFLLGGGSLGLGLNRHLFGLECGGLLLLFFRAATLFFHGGFGSRSCICFGFGSRGWCRVGRNLGSLARAEERTSQRREHFGHGGHGGHLERGELEVETREVVGLGQFGNQIGLVVYGLGGRFTLDTAVKLGIFQCRLGEELGLEALTLALGFIVVLRKGVALLGI